MRQPPPSRGAQTRRSRAPAPARPGSPTRVAAKGLIALRYYPPRKASRWRDKDGNRTGGKPGWAKLRKQALDRDGHRCTFTTYDGVRCTRTTDLVVHHLNPGTEQIVPLDQLATSCPDHHPRNW